MGVAGVEMRRFVLRAVVVMLVGGWVLTPARGQAPEADAGLVADRVSLALTGLPATAQERADFRSGKISASALAASRKGSPALERRLVEHWMRSLRILSPFNPFTSVDAAGNSVAGDFMRPTKALRAKSLVLDNSSNFVTINGRSTVECRYYTVYSAPQGVTRNCACADVETVTPYWNPAITVPACKQIRVDTACGADLRHCFPLHEGYLAQTGGKVAGMEAADLLVNDLTEEPALLAARVILDDRPWDDVLVGREGIVTGVVEDFFARFDTRLRTLGLPETYGFGTAAVRLQQRNPLDRSARWVDRGPGHAGILTTMSFQATFNGYRARANAGMEAFLCRKFVVPLDAVPVPSDETDLAKKPYCSICHQTLEPMAAFFRRWDSKANFLYVPGREAAGAFQGHSDVDALGYGKALVRTPDFAECAVERAFRFLAGRGFTDEEAVTLQPALVKTYQDGGRRIWPVLERIVETPQFQGRTLP